MYNKTPLCQVKNLPDIYMSQFGYKTSGNFVEVGAFNCYNWSNTFCLAQAGWHGLLIEPQEKFINKCQRLYKDNPKITLEQSCIGRKNGKVLLYLGGSQSTIKRGMIETYNSIDWAKFSGLHKDKFIECNLYTLDTVLDRYNHPSEFEVLVIDVEGAELDVLAGFNVRKWQPKMVIIEAHEQYDDKRLSGKAHKIDEYFSDYVKIYSDDINNIYVNPR